MTGIWFLKLNLVVEEFTAEKCFTTLKREREREIEAKNNL